MKAEAQLRQACWAEYGGRGLDSEGRRESSCTPYSFCDLPQLTGPLGLAPHYLLICEMETLSTRKSCVRINENVRHWKKTELYSVINVINVLCNKCNKCFHGSTPGFIMLGLPLLYILSKVTAETGNRKENIPFHIRPTLSWTSIQEWLGE